MTNYARIARNDDETFSDEDTFVSERRDALVAERRKLIEYVRDALDDALMADGDDYFATRLAEFFINYGRGDRIERTLNTAYDLHHAIEHLITERLERDAETDAQAEWENRQVGAPE